LFFLLADILQALVLILFDEGGVGSMKPKRKTRKQNETFGIFENQQEMSQWIVFVKRNNCI